MIRLRILACLAIATIAAAPVAGQDGAAVADRVVNDPRPQALNVYGLRLPPAIRADKGVQFGRAVRVPVTRASAATGEIGAVSPVLKPIKAGDRVVIAFWARAHATENGAPGKVAGAMLERSTPPHQRVFEQPVDIGPDWKMHTVSGRADRDYTPGELNATLHLAGAKQVIDLGPVFVLRYPR